MNRINATEPFTDAVPLDTVPQLVEYPIKHANSCTPEICTQSELRGASGTSAFSEGGPSKDVTGGSTQPCYKRADRTTPRDIQQTPNTPGRVMLICKLQEIEIDNNSGPARPTSVYLLYHSGMAVELPYEAEGGGVEGPVKQGWVTAPLPTAKEYRSLIFRRLGYPSLKGNGGREGLKQEHDLKNANLIIPNTPAAHDGFLVWNLDLDHTQNQGERVKSTNSGCRTTAKLPIQLIYIIPEFKFNLIKVQL
ncbi:hypothetical protein B0H16DRAFT_1471511 [Mycena metata]|uniref:Uncharacterized protein n=1 Tax=Mycena metata TaxID=1033252 RepID=A0AAD7MQ71_9AGAR|nr:hypothetical protein B0H16DRAFT_1471511 [Mycena metata]